MKKSILVLFFCFPLFLFSQNWNQIGNDIDGANIEDFAGQSISFNGDGTIVVIGSSYNDDNGWNSGHARVFENINGSWNQIGQTIIGEASGDYFGCSASISSNGNIIAIGANYNDNNFGNAGHVRVYENNGGTWVQIGQDIDGEALSDESGYSVSLSSDGMIVAIGAPNNGFNVQGIGDNKGHVRVYEYDGSSWSQLGQDIDGEAGGNYSGISVSLSSDGMTVAIGATGNDDNGISSGHVRIYNYNGSSWSQLGQDIDGEAAHDQTGHSVSLSSDGITVAIGAPSNDGNGSNSGHVRVYEYINGSWNQIGQDIDGEAVDDNSGYSVSLSADGDIVAIGAHGYDQTNDPYDNSGHVRVFENINGSWIQIGQHIVGEYGGNASFSGDKSGYSIALTDNGQTVAIGAPYNNDGLINGNSTGHVRVYSTNTFGCTDSLANNYNPYALIDDNTCLYSPFVFGCTDSTSINFNPLASVDDGSCCG